MTASSDEHHRAFGDFLRTRRERLSPEALGLSVVRRRRTPGLRREEVAELAGIGVDWYIRLEQGRAVRPSVGTLDALASALALGAVDRAHLHALATPVARPGFVREALPPTLGRLVAALAPPAYVTGRRWDLLVANRAATRLFERFGDLPANDRNVLVYMFTTDAARRVFGRTWADEAKRMVAQFRPTWDLWATDPSFRSLLERLRDESRLFARWWDAHDVRVGGSGRKRLSLGSGDERWFEYATFQSNDDAALKLAIYTPMEASGGSTEGDPDGRRRAGRQPSG